ncbi:outer membrane protein assembly factor BamB family protein [Chitinophaga alhagiae]|uniref:outer membrane protein assembly factor BamB family protein n=1 Tax=Chitinophaga alhagiae TaxID=2203219 RepID=UPI001E2F6A12|nr:PQQ-binding-like beta-propeller repeat protein [Chitinophaga alhagiae]
MRYSIVPFILLLAACHSTGSTEWPAYNGGNKAQKYSTLKQIDTANARHLRVAWQYRTGDADTAKGSQIQCNPLVVNGMLYGISPRLKLFALQAATGAPQWVFDPFEKSEAANVNNARGLAYYADGDSSARLFYTAGAFLYCINAANGRPVQTFGSNGRIDLHDHLGEAAKNLYVTSTSPGMIYKDQIMVGTRVSEGADAAPGHIRSYNVHTGQMQWIFHTIPQPGEFGHETWKDPQAYRHIGGANAWAGFSLDEERGILFAPVGSAAFDFYGARRLGTNLFANCLLALDANTGQRLWHFQGIHHDVWDRDLPAPPALVTVTYEGKPTDAVAQTSKTGFLFLLDRESGKPLFPVVEKDVPHQSPLPGEVLSPTQPYALHPKPFVRQGMTEADLLTQIPDSSYQDIKTRFAALRKSHMFEPPSKEGTLMFPGFDGGGEWGGPAFDPATGMLYINANEVPWILQMVDVTAKRHGGETMLAAGRRLYQQHCMSCHGGDRKGGGNYPSLLDAEKRYTAQAVLDLLQTGRRMMPAFSYLHPEERKAVTQYILNMPAAGPYTGPSTPIDSFRNLPYNMAGYKKFQTKEGYPAVTPPWGTLSAIDLNTGEYRWKVPLGTSALGNTGTENYGAPVVTAGGLLIIAATPDSQLRIFNKRNGALLWETTLPAPGFATPAVYEAGGKQYIVIACGGGKLGTKPGDSYVAFALGE